MTPQIARIAATRLADRPLPMRLCYEGTVLRRRQERARKHRQIPQAGVELLGVAGPEGDLELLNLAVGRPAPPVFPTSCSISVTRTSRAR
jgi:ATP phosphoribosyltransferase regulatory subunit